MSHLDLQSYSIGMFDSGMGGLTVMQELLKALPQEQIIYFGDTARLPYGEKSRETIIRYSIENSIFLLEKKIKVLVVPCNTACAFALDKLKRIFNIPIVGVIEPGAERAVQMSPNGRIAVLGTKATIRSGAYQKAILQHMPEAVVTSIACPLFVPLVEEHFMHHEAARMIVREYLKPIKENPVDTILLGCTHYPLLKDLIQEEAGSHVAIVDSATTCAKKVESTLTSGNLHASKSAWPQHQYFVSDDAAKFQKIGAAFLGASIKDVELISAKSFSY